jgi:hypothetical protein
MHTCLHLYFSQTNLIIVHPNIRNLTRDDQKLLNKLATFWSCCQAQHKLKFKQLLRIEISALLPGFYKKIAFASKEVGKNCKTKTGQKTDCTAAQVWRVLKKP